MTVINTNIAASITATAMKSNARAMENTMERLATGTRVNSASDDAAGLAIGSKMTPKTATGLVACARVAWALRGLLRAWLPAIAYWRCSSGG